MRRALVVVAAVGMVFLVPLDASAGFWSWLEGFSGPGPLRTRKGRPPVLSTFCVQDTKFQPSPLAESDAFHRRQWQAAVELTNDAVTAKPEVAYKRLLANPTPAESFLVPDGRSFAQLLQAQRAEQKQQESVVVPNLTLPAAVRFYGSELTDSGPGHKDQTPICVYFDFGSFTNDVSDGGRDLNGYPSVTAQLFDFGGVARLHDGIDIGAGFGMIRFTGESMQPLTRATLTPFRSLIRPILLVLPEHSRKKWMGILSLYWKETYVMGELTSADFGAPAIDYRSNGELVRSFGVTLDLTALIPTIGISKKAKANK
jgi:hypothetical protein